MKTLNSGSTDQFWCTEVMRKPQATLNSVFLIVNQIYVLDYGSVGWLWFDTWL